jgi:hypothetical protein
VAFAPFALGLLFSTTSIPEPAPAAVDLTPPPALATMPALRLRLADAGETASAPVDARQAQLESTHRLLRTATGVSLLVTGALGGLVALNRPTLLGDGRCASGDPIFGNYGCNSLSIVHGASAVASVALYTATGVLGLALPEGVAFGRRDAAWYRAVGWVHVVGIFIQPVLGLLAHYPEVIGVPNSSQQQFGKTLRTIHVFTGDLIAASYLVTWLAAED